MDNIIEIAKTIRSQIGMVNLMAMGAKNYIALGPKQGHEQGALQFVASFFGKRSCTVTISLTPADLYKVTLTRPRNGQVIAEADGVFCEDLAGFLVEQTEQWFAKGAA